MRLVNKKVFKSKSDHCDGGELASGGVRAALGAFLNDSCGGDKAVSLSFHLSFIHCSRQEDDRQLSHQPVNVILPLLCQIECENLFSHKKTLYVKVPQPDGSGNTTQPALFQ